MKIRNGFVSNSSSSSFVILYDSTKRKAPQYTDENIFDFMECSSCRMIQTDDDFEWEEKVGESGIYDILPEDLDECDTEFQNLCKDKESKSALQCICEFLKDNPTYRLMYFRSFDNGLAAWDKRENLDRMLSKIIRVYHHDQ